MKETGKGNGLNLNFNYNPCFWQICNLETYPVTSVLPEEGPELRQREGQISLIFLVNEKAFSVCSVHNNHIYHTLVVIATLQVTKQRTCKMHK